MPKNSQPASRRPSSGARPARPGSTSTSVGKGTGTGGDDASQDASEGAFKDDAIQADATGGNARTTAAKTPAARSKPASSAKPASLTKGAAKPSTRPGGRNGARPTTASGTGRKAPGKPKSIVAKKQRPWGLIATAALVVVFAVAVIVYAVTRDSGSSNEGSNPYTRNEIETAEAIDGVTYKKEPDHTHVTEKVNYNASPPVGGNHAQYWADCTGTVYTAQIANENGVHSLEHGAVWITYDPSLSAADVATLAASVTGVDRMLMSPYPGLKSKVSLQSWGYQLFVDDVNDDRIAAFIKALKFNPATTPEPGATCSNPAFKTSPSTPDKPTF